MHYILIHILPTSVTSCNLENVELSRSIKFMLNVYVSIMISILIQPT